MLPGSLTPTIILLSLVTWIPRGNKGDTERKGFIFPDFVKRFISEVELLPTDRSMSLFEVNVMSKISPEKEITTSTIRH
jgi:hypothetical protein